MAPFNRPVMLLISLVVVYLGNEATADSSAPALFWSPERSMRNLADINIVDTLKPDMLLKNYLDPLMKTSSESAVVFLQKKLHIDDFTKFADVYSLESDGGAFKNIKGFMEDHFSLELPQVEDPLKAVEALKSSFSGAVHSVSSLAQVERLSLGPGEKFLLIVQLTPPDSAVDEEEAIKANDVSVGAICHHLQKRGIKYTALFTGEPESQSKAPIAETFSGRHLLAKPDNNGTLLNVSGAFIFLRDIEVHVEHKGKKQDYNFTITDDAAANSTVANNTALIKLDFSGQPTNGTGTQNVQLSLNTTNLGDRWQINRISLTMPGQGGEAGNGSLTNTTLVAQDVDLVVPILYSFHCSNFKLYVDSIKNKSLADYQNTYVILKGFQIQPFNVSKDAFFNAQDCVGFFTPGIWMGIIPSLILLGILLFGTLMVLNLSTPDRFDDPKGKTIVIAQAED